MRSAAPIVFAASGSTFGLSTLNSGQAFIKRRLSGITRALEGCSVTARKLPLPCSLSLVILGIEFSQAVWTYSVSEFRFGMGLKITFQDLPLVALIPDLLAVRADWQQTAQHLYLIESLLELDDRLFQESSVDSGAEQAEEPSGRITKRLYHKIKIMFLAPDGNADFSVCFDSRPKDFLLNGRYRRAVFNAEDFGISPADVFLARKEVRRIDPGESQVQI